MIEQKTEIQKKGVKRMNKENTKFQRNSQEKGITLIALVITIVILIILATVTINFAFGGDGLIRRAEQASEFYANDTKYTDESISNVTGYVDGVLSELGIENGSGDNPGDDDTPTAPEGWDTSKVTPVVSYDRVTVPVPIGYTASDATGENAVSSGFVIYENVVNGTNEVNDENVEDAKLNRNQFVWVPVDDISQIANVAQNGGIDSNGRTNYQGKLYNFDADGAEEKTDYGQGTTSYREPDVVTGNSDGTGTQYDGSSTYVTNILRLADSNAFKTQLQEEFNEMIESVDTYGGFYIGRYETGNLASNLGAEPVVVKSNNNIGDVNWYYMYQNSKLIKANDNVESTMIWGCMWDRTLIWLAETNAENSANGKAYAEIANSSTWGNYSNNTEEGAGTRQETGYKESWKANNIYDLAGNVRDWTLEAYDTDGRVKRGGNYLNSGSGDPASYRDGSNPSNSMSSGGTRSALYVK